MSQPKPKGYDTTVARIAGNILSGAFKEEALRNIGFSADLDSWQVATVGGALKLAREVVAQTKRTEPTEPTREEPTR